MKPLKPKVELESSIQRKIKQRLEGAGFYVKNCHGSRFQAGLPDLYCCHPEYGAFWVEVKRPKTGRLTAAQKRVFAELEAHGVGVWVLTSDDEWLKLFCDPNWRESK